RGPLGVHLLTGRRYPFLDPISLRPVSQSVQATMEYLQSVARVSVGQVEEALAALRHGPESPAPHQVRPHFVPATELDHGRGLSPIQRLKERMGDPYAFISQFVELDEMGQGHCPFHPPDRNPSFIVDRQSGMWTCFHEVD